MTFTPGPPPDYFVFQSFDVSPDGRSIALGGWSRRPPRFGGASAVRAWDTSTGEEIYRIGHELTSTTFPSARMGEHLVTASWDDTAKIVDRSGRVIRVLRDDGFDLHDAVFSPDGRLVATAAFRGSAEAHVKIWDWERDEVVRTFEDAYGVAWDPTGLRIATGGLNGLVEIGT